MRDLHRENRTTLRAPAQVKEAARQALRGEDGWTLNDVLVACLVMLAAKPRTFLKMLEPYKPPRKRGRPRKHPD